MGSASVIETFGGSRSFQTRHGSRVAIVGAGMLGTTLALRYRQAGRIVTVFEAAERTERRGHTSVASRDRALLALLEELELSARVRWDGPSMSGVRFGELRGGRGQIVETLRDRARAIDVDVRLGTPVRVVSFDGSGFQIDAGADTGDFDEVVLTVPSPVAAQLTSALPDRERKALQKVGYVGIINVSFVLKRQTGHGYITRVARGGDTFTLIEPGALTAPDDRRCVVYVTRPLSSSHDMFALNDRTTIEHFARALPGNAEILSARVMRMPHAFAERQLMSFVSSIPGLSVVNAAHMAVGKHHLERTAALAVTVFRTLCAERIS